MNSGFNLFSFRTRLDDLTNFISTSNASQPDVSSLLKSTNPQPIRQFLLDFPLVNVVQTRSKIPRSQFGRRIENGRGEVVVGEL